MRSPSPPLLALRWRGLLRPGRKGRAGVAVSSSAESSAEAIAEDEKRVTERKGGGWAAAGGVAGLALASEAFQIVNTALGLLLLRRLTQAEGIVPLAEMIVDYFRSMGWAAYPAYGALLLTLQVLPLMSALVYIVLAGAIFGPIGGTAVVSLSLSLASACCCLISRAVSRKVGFGLAAISPVAASVDSEVAKQGLRSTLLLLVLVRLSPVIPFTFANYLFGLTSVPAAALGVATFIGTMPSQIAYVSAGAVGHQVLSGRLQLPPAVVLAGAVATAAAMYLIGKVAQRTLKELDVSKDLETAA